MVITKTEVVLFLIAIALWVAVLWGTNLLNK